MSGDSNARVFLMCNAKSSFGPPGFLCNNNTTVPLRLGAGNDFTIDADGWSVMFDEDDEPIVRCPKHHLQAVLTTNPLVNSHSAVLQISSRNNSTTA